mmetsp:Transcript_27623/g.80691  ORF Transcript_27623/g.80691 Transcript_27623/m.80691 type:complete len:213 (+) Transcript_27623:868-1506(+)
MMSWVVHRCFGEARRQVGLQFLAPCRLSSRSTSLPVCHGCLVQGPLDFAVQLTRGLFDMDHHAHNRFHGGMSGHDEAGVQPGLLVRPSVWLSHLVLRRRHRASLGRRWEPGRDVQHDFASARGPPFFKEKNIRRRQTCLLEGEVRERLAEPHLLHLGYKLPSLLKPVREPEPAASCLTAVESRNRTGLLLEDLHGDVLAHGELDHRAAGSGA